MLATGADGLDGVDPPNRLKVPDPLDFGAGDGAVGVALGAGLGALLPKKPPNAGLLLFFGATGSGLGVSATGFFSVAAAPPNKLNVPLPFFACGLLAGAGGGV